MRSESRGGWGADRGKRPRALRHVGRVLHSRCIDLREGLPASCYVEPVTQDQSLSSALLVAMPQLQDPNFRRTVTLIVEHDEDGTFGLVLNREVDLLASTLCASLDVEWRGDPEANIRWGGPVEPSSGWMLWVQIRIRSAGKPHAITMIGPFGLSHPQRTRGFAVNAKAVFDVIAPVGVSGHHPGVGSGGG